MSDPDLVWFTDGACGDVRVAGGKGASLAAMTAAGLPNTFVPGRNLLFFTYAAALAYRRGIRALVGGMCETDYSGYPDCRNDTLQTLASAISLGLNTPFIIETPPKANRVMLLTSIPRDWATREWQSS